MLTPFVVQYVAELGLMDRRCYYIVGYGHIALMMGKN